MKIPMRRACPSWKSCFLELLVSAGLLVASSSAVYHEAYLDDPTITLENAYNYVDLLKVEIPRQENAEARKAMDEELFVVGYEVLLMAPCATGRFNAHEEWVAYIQIATRDLLYRKRGSSLAQENAPCALILTQSHALRNHRDAERREHARRPIVETFDDRVGNYVAVEWEQLTSIILLEDGQSIAVPNFEQEEYTADKVDRIMSVEESWRRQAFFEENAFAFTSTVDVLDGVQRRSEFALATEEFVSTVDVFERDDLEADDLTVAATYRLLEQLLLVERKLLTPISSGLTDLTWQPSFGVEEWKELRELTPLWQREELSLHWTLLAKIILVANNNATSSMNCLRRAVSWNPSEVPAYLQMSSILENYGYQNSSCQIMEKILENVDPAEFGSGEMRSVLTKNFPHCSVIIRMANLWESSLAVRCVLAASAVVSLLHGVFIAGSFVYDRVGRSTGQNTGAGRVDNAALPAQRPELQQAAQAHSKSKHE